MREKGNHNRNNLESTTIICCMKGLVLLKDRYGVFGTVRFTIWNPATRQCLKIPRPYNIDDFEGMNNCFSAFGFDSGTNDVKIVHVTAIVKRRLVGYIYSCKAGCWRKITPSNFFFRGHILNFKNPVIVHGSPFWLWYRHCPKKEHLVVISFDVQRGSFRLLPNIGGSTSSLRYSILSRLLPNIDGSTGSLRYSTLSRYKLLNFKDSLAIMYCSNKFNWRSEKFEIYVFNERSDVWSKMSTGPFEFLSHEPKLYLYPRFLQCFRNGDILFLSSEVRELYYIDLQNRTIKKLGKEEDLHYNVSVGYTESTFFIDGMKPFYEKEKEVQFFFLRKTGEDIQRFWHSSASLRAARQDLQNIPYVELHTD